VDLRCCGVVVLEGLAQLFDANVAVFLEGVKDALAQALDGVVLALERKRGRVRRRERHTERERERERESVCV
jgi:hypothetical protein